MFKTTLKIDGMACGMCEAHMNDAVRKSMQVKKVSSSHKKGITEIISETEIDKAAIEKAIADTGYILLSMDSEPYVKKGLFG